MPAKLGEEKVRQIIRLRSMDYPKQKIAEELDCSRTTVTNKLTSFREQVRHRFDLPPKGELNGQ